MRLYDVETFFKLSRFCIEAIDFSKMSNVCFLLVQCTTKCHFTKFKTDILQRTFINPTVFAAASTLKLEGNGPVEPAAS